MMLRKIGGQAVQKYYLKRMSIYCTTVKTNQTHKVRKYSYGKAGCQGASAPLIQGYSFVCRIRLSMCKMSLFIDFK